MNLNSIDVLLVEDNEDDAKLTIRELKKHKLANNLVHLKDGQDALDFIFAMGKYASSRLYLYSPKVVLLDINIPKVNGIEVLQIIKADPRSRTLPVVILTSSNDSPDIKRCYELGANSYIVKPVNHEDFSKAIMSLGIYWKLFNQLLE
jgi:two-component system response regulator